MKALLLNMRDYRIEKEFENMAAAQAAMDAALDAPFDFPTHLVEKEEWDLTAVDMAKFYNNLPGVIPVKRFSDRKAAMARLLRALNGEVAPVVDETAIKEVTRKKRTGHFAGGEKAATINEETDMKAKKKATPKSNGSTRLSVAETAVLSTTKAGEERSWHKENPRYKLFAYVQKKGETTFKEFLHYGETTLGLARGAVLAAFTKLTDSARNAGGASIKVSGRNG
jgi:hypothetical protein